MKKFVTMSLIAAAALGAAACTPKSEPANETIVSNDTVVEESNMTTVDDANVVDANAMTANAM